MASYDNIDDISDWKALQQTRVAKARQRARPVLEEHVQAAVHASQLTSSSTWNTFLQMLQPKLDEAAAALEGLEGRFSSPEMLTDDELRGLREQAMLLTERINTITEVLEMPREIMLKGEASREQLHSSATAEAD